MKAIKIDVEQQSIYKIELEGGKGHLQSIYNHLKCDCFTIGCHYPNGDYLYVDDNGLLEPYEKIKGVFQIQGQPQPLVGHGLVVGCDEEGEACDVRLTTNEVEAMTEFIPKEHIKEFINSFK